MVFHGWYDLLTPEKEFKKLLNLQFCGTFGPARNEMTQRFTSHFNLIYTDAFSDDSLKKIFNNIVEWWFFNNTDLNRQIVSLKNDLIAGSVSIYNKISITLRPTPSKMHYLFNLRDISKIFQGMFMSNQSAITDANDLCKLWIHEVLRIFSDRLINTSDRETFLTELKGVLNTNLKEK